MISQSEHTFNGRTAAGCPVDLVALSTAITARLEAEGARPHAGELQFRCPAPEHEDKSPSAGWKQDGGKGAGGIWCCHARHCEGAHGGGGALPTGADALRAAPIPWPLTGQDAAAA